MGGRLSYGKTIDMEMKTCAFSIDI